MNNNEIKTISDYEKEEKLLQNLYFANEVDLLTLRIRQACECRWVAPLGYSSYKVAFEALDLACKKLENRKRFLINDKRGKQVYEQAIWEAQSLKEDFKHYKL